MSRPCGADPFGDRPFTTAAALSSGLSDRVLHGPRYRPLLHGVHVRAGVPDSPQLRYDAARLVLPLGAVASHHLAAQLLGATVPDSEVIHMTVPGSAGHERAGLRVHRFATRRPVVRTGGRLVTAPVVTFLSLAAELSLLDLVVLGDSLVAVTRVTPRDLVDAARQTRGRGVRLARVAASLVREGVESPMETRLRLVLVLAGLPEPAVNASARTEDGRWLARPDLGYARERIAVEYDGRHHIRREQQWEADLPRRERLESHGWWVLVVTARQLYTDPRGVVLRVAAALRQRGTDVRPVFSGLWADIVTRLRTAPGRVSA